MPLSLNNVELAIGLMILETNLYFRTGSKLRPRAKTQDYIQRQSRTTCISLPETRLETQHLYLSNGCLLAIQAYCDHNTFTLDDAGDESTVVFS